MFAVKKGCSWADGRWTWIGSGKLRGQKSYLPWISICVVRRSMCTAEVFHCFCKHDGLQLKWCLAIAFSNCLPFVSCILPKLAQGPFSISVQQSRLKMQYSGLVHGTQQKKHLGAQGLSFFEPSGLVASVKGDKRRSKQPCWASRSTAYLLQGRYWATPCACTWGCQVRI